MPACHAGDRRFESGRVRHHRISLRPVRPPGRGVPLPGRSRPAADRGTSVTLRRVTRRPVPIAAGLVLVALVAVLAAGRSSGSSAASAAPSRERRPRRDRRRRTARPPGDADRRRGRRGAEPGARRRAAAPADPGRRPPRSPTCRSCPVTQFRTTAHGDHAQGRRRVLAGTSTRYDALELVDERGADAILAALGVAGRRPGAPRHCSPTSRPSPRTSPRTASGSRSCAPTRSGRRSAPWPGATRRCSASIASRTSPTGR